MTHNQENIEVQRLYELLSSISKYFEEEIHMYALGGTALTILGIKNSTLDIDINIGSYRSYRYCTKIFKHIGFIQSSALRWITQEGLVFDLFHGSQILGTHLLADCLEKSTFIKQFGTIHLHTLAVEDIIISKLARGDVRDFDDIQSIFNKRDIEIHDLVQRYKETMEQSVVGQAKQKLLDLIDIKFSEWGMKKDLTLIEEVKRWEQA